MAYNDEPVTGSGYSYRFDPEPFYVDPRTTQRQVSPPEPPRKKRGGAAKIIALCLICALLGGAAGGVISYKLVSPAVAPTAPIVTPNSSGTSSQEGALETAESAVYAANVNSCVHISIVSTGTLFGRPISAVVSGSGFVITQDGYIVTNYHVLSSVTDESVIKVGFQNGTSLTAKIVATEQSSDLALLKVNITGLTPVRFGDSSLLKVGYKAYVIGDPLGEYSFSMTSGCISGFNRSVTTEYAANVRMFQLDAAVNSGNSGGPVFNALGEVIGVVTAKPSKDSVDGVGFALYSNDVVRIINDLVEFGYVTGKPYYGITAYAVTEAIAAEDGNVVGICIASLIEGGAGEKSGLKVDDVITAVDGVKVLTMDDLARTKWGYQAGDSAVITVWRAGETLDIDFVFGEAPLEDPE